MRNPIGMWRRTQTLNLEPQDATRGLYRDNGKENGNYRDYNYRGRIDFGAIFRAYSKRWLAGSRRTSVGFHNQFRAYGSEFRRFGDKGLEP